MKQFTGIVFFLLILFCDLFSCKKDAAIPDMGYNYYPDKVGTYVVYDVDSFYYNGFNLNAVTHFAEIDTFKFQVKEKMESVYFDNQNRPTIRLERYKRYYNDSTPYNSLPWILTDVWAENRTATTAEKVEENVRYIKLSFPLKENKSWNGNVQNTQDAQEYNYEFIDRPRTYGILHFDSALQVTQMDDHLVNRIAHQYKIEQYARNIGLVYKQYIDVGSQYPSQWNGTSSDSIILFLNKPVMQRVTSGVQYIMTINAYGTEP